MCLNQSKSIRYSGVRFHIFYCNSAGLSDVFRYNGVFVIAGLCCNFHSNRIPNKDPDAPGMSFSVGITF